MIIAGMGGGFLAGLLGIGGAPIYVVLFSFLICEYAGTELSSSDQVKMVIAHTSFAKIFAALSGCYQQYSMGNFYPLQVRTIAIPAIVVSLSLTYFLSTVTYSKTTFSIIFICMLLPMLYKMLTDDRKKKKFNQPYTIKVLYLNLLGVVSGAIAGLSGMGGGIIVIPLLNSLFNIKIRKVISISLGVILLVSIAVTAYYFLLYDFSGILPYTYGAISFSLALPVVLGVSLAAPWGVTVSKKMTPFALRLIFIVVCALLICYTLFDMIYGPISDC